MPEAGNVWHFIGLRGRRNPDVQFVTDFVAECLKFDEAEPVLGSKPKSPDGYGDYLRVRHQRSRLGGFAFVTPSSGKVELRLTVDRAEGREYAEAVVKKDKQYAVRIYLRSEEAVAEALELAKMAYDGGKP